MVVSTSLTEHRLAFAQAVRPVVTPSPSAARVRVAELDGYRPVRCEDPAELFGDVEKGGEVGGGGWFGAVLERFVRVVSRQV